MAGKFHHEELYRSRESMAMLAELSVTVCGAGALGSNLADNLVRQGFGKLRVIDRDRVQEHNINTQIYGEDDVGVWKTEALANRLFRSTGVEIDSVRKELTDRNARKLLSGCDVVVDTLDNSASRALVQNQSRDSGTECLHVGLFEGYGEVVWDGQYRVPDDVVAEDTCDYPLARNIVLLTVAIATESLIRFVLDGAQVSRSITLGDFAVRPLLSPSSVSN